MKKKITALVIAIGMLFAFAACSPSPNGETQPSDEINTQATQPPTEEETADETQSEPPQEQETEKPEQKDIYKIGDTWTVDGKWKLTITGVEETYERNQFSEKEPAAVYIVDYTYENLGIEGGIMDGLYMNVDDTIVDSSKKMGYTYPNSVTYPQVTPIGAMCEAQACIGVDNAGPFTLTVKKYDDDFTAYKAVFEIEVN